jgi:hypothetical protein
MISIKIDNVDRSSIIEFGSVSKIDAINQLVDTLSFSILVHEGQTYRPETNSEVVMMDDSEIVFAGRIYSVAKSQDEQGIVRYQVKCKDYSYDLDRELVNEGYEEMTVEDIIADIIDTYAPTFTYANVVCTLPVTKVVFDRITVSSAIQKLSDLTGFAWYVGYDKDIHFFEKNSEPAPFNVTDNNGNYIPDSLEVSKDFSQIRNRVFIKGAEIEGEERTEVFDGNGVKKQFKLSNKFSSLPTVSVSGVSKTVGVDFLSNEDDYDCFWDFNQQYIRFKDTTIPGSGTNNIEVTGLPLYTLMVQVEEPVSIAQYGVFEFAKTDKTIKSREEAVSLAKTEIQAYKDGLVEGSFDTYTPGLRSGQVIRVTSDIMDIDELFLVQQTSFKMISKDQGLWKVKLATLRTVGIIEFLIGLLKSGERLIEDKGDVVLEKTVFPIETFTFGDEIAINTDDVQKAETLEVEEALYPQAIDFPVQFVAGPYVPDPSDSGDYKRVFILNGSRLG